MLRHARDARLYSTTVEVDRDMAIAPTTSTRAISRENVGKSHREIAWHRTNDTMSLDGFATPTRSPPVPPDLAALLGSRP